MFGRVGGAEETVLLGTCNSYLSTSHSFVSSKHALANNCLLISDNLFMATHCLVISRLPYWDLENGQANMSAIKISCMATGLHCCKKLG